MVLFLCKYEHLEGQEDKVLECEVRQPLFLHVLSFKYLKQAFYSECHFLPSTNVVR